MDSILFTLLRDSKYDSFLNPPEWGWTRGIILKGENGNSLPPTK